MKAKVHKEASEFRIKKLKLKLPYESMKELYQQVIIPLFSFLLYLLK